MTKTIVLTLRLCVETDRYLKSGSFVFFSRPLEEVGGDMAVVGRGRARVEAVVPLEDRDDGVEAARDCRNLHRRQPLVIFGSQRSTPET